MKDYSNEMLSNLTENEKKYRNAHYEFLTRFSYLEMLIIHCITSFKFDDKVEGMRYAANNYVNYKKSKILIDFKEVLNKKNIPFSQNLAEFHKLNNLRNDFAHSYFVPKNPKMKNGFCFTKIYSKSKMSVADGFTKNISDEEYQNKYSNLEKLIKEVFEIMINDFKKN